jgi:uncharacterized membrane protein YhiD involved in acid resistance
VPGSAKEISTLFMAMAIGLATGTGYITVAVIFTVIIIAVSFLYSVTNFGETERKEKELKITVPEGVNYMEIFKDLFKEYTTKAELVRAKTSNMGSLYKLQYMIILKDPAKEKIFIDELRCRNSNLEIACGRITNDPDEL